MAVTKKATKVSNKKKVAAPKAVALKAAAPKAVAQKVVAHKAVAHKAAAPKAAAPKAAAPKAAAAKAAPAKAAPAKATAHKAAPPRKAAPRRASGDGNGHGRASFIDGLARRLDEHRREILHLYRHDLDVGLDAFRDGDDEIDRANFDSDRDLALSLSDTERDVLLQIEEALRRIQGGQFGSCTSCSKPIGDQRLHAIPWARYCIDCQELEEKGLLG